MWKILRDQRGATAVLTALGMTALVGITALVVDVGYWYINRIQVSNMIDAAVLAGAQDLPDVTKARASAVSYAALNGKSDDTVNFQFDSDTVSLLSNGESSTIAGSAQRKVINLFSRVITGANTTTVSATAKAQLFPLGSAVGVVPIGVVQQEFSFGTTYTLKVGGGDGTTGNYGALALGGNGASNYLDNIKSGYNGTLRAGDWVITETGNISGPTSDGINYRIEQDSGATYNTVSESSPRIVLLPVLESLTVNGKGEVKITGFAAFFLEGAVGSGNENTVTGKFLRMVIAGEPSTSGGNYGLSTVRLIQ